MIRCPKCGEDAIPYFLTVHKCLKCGHTFDGNDDKKNC